MNRRCQKCNAPRKTMECRKCGSPTFKPHPSWVEPELPSVDRIRELAKEVGYALGEHGTKERDLDLIAAPWSLDAVGHRELMEHIAKGINAIIIDIEGKPLGRYACTLQLNGWFKPVDLSVCPRVFA